MGNMVGAEEVSEVKQSTRPAGVGGAPSGGPGGSAPPVKAAKQLDINALLAQRKQKLQGGGGGVAELEAAQAEKQAQHLADMGKKADAQPPPTGMLGGDMKNALLAGSKDMAKKTAQNVDGEEKTYKDPREAYLKKLAAGTQEASEESAKEAPKKPEAKAIVVPPLEGTESGPARRKKKKVSVEEEEVDIFASVPVTEKPAVVEAAPEPEPEAPAAKPTAATIVMPELESQAPTRRRPRKQPSVEEEDVDIFASVPTTAQLAEETPEEAPSFRTRIAR